MIVDCWALMPLFLLEILCFPKQLPRLFWRTLDGHILDFYLTWRTVDHVFDDKLPITQFANATSLACFLSSLFPRSEKPGFLQTLLTSWLPTEMAMWILKFSLFLPFTLTSIASWCIFKLPLVNRPVHKENIFIFVKLEFPVTNDKNSTCFHQFIDLIVWPSVQLSFLNILVYDDAIHKRFLEALLVLDEFCQALDHFSLWSIYSDGAYISNIIISAKKTAKHALLTFARCNIVLKNWVSFTISFIGRLTEMITVSWTWFSTWTCKCVLIVGIRANRT